MPSVKYKESVGLTGNVDKIDIVPTPSKTVIYAYSDLLLKIPRSFRSKKIYAHSASVLVLLDTTWYA